MAECSVSRLKPPFSLEDLPWTSGRIEAEVNVSAITRAIAWLCTVVQQADAAHEGLECRVAALTQTEKENGQPQDHSLAERQEARRERTARELLELEVAGLRRDVASRARAEDVSNGLAQRGELLLSQLQGSLASETEQLHEQLRLVTKALTEQMDLANERIDSLLRKSTWDELLPRVRSLELALARPGPPTNEAIDESLWSVCAVEERVKALEAAAEEASANAPGATEMHDQILERIASLQSQIEDSGRETGQGEKQDIAKMGTDIAEVRSQVCQSQADVAEASRVQEEMRRLLSQLETRISDLATDVRTVVPGRDTQRRSAETTGVSGSVADDAANAGLGLHSVSATHDAGNEGDGLDRASLRGTLKRQAQLAQLRTDVDELQAQLSQISRSGLLPSPAPHASGDAASAELQAAVIAPDLPDLSSFSEEDTAKLTKIQAGARGHLARKHAAAAPTAVGARGATGAAGAAGATGAAGAAGPPGGSGSVAHDAANAGLGLHSVSAIHDAGNDGDGLDRASLRGTLAHVAQLRIDVDELHAQLAQVSRRGLLPSQAPHASGDAGSAELQASYTDGAKASFPDLLDTENNATLIANFANAVRGLQRDADLQSGKVQDLAEGARRVDSALPQLVHMLESLIQQLGGHGVDPDVLKGLSGVRDVLGMPAGDGPHPFVSETLLRDAIEQAQAEVRKWLKKLQDEIHRALGSKADAAHLKMLSLELEATANRRSRSLPATPPDENVGFAAITRIPMGPARCIVCDSKVEAPRQPTTLRRPWNVPGSQWQARLGASPSEPVLRRGAAQLPPIHPL